MKTNTVFSPDLVDILLEGFAYLLWLVNTLVCVVVVLQMQSMVNALWVVIGGDRYSLSLVNQVFLLLGGFITFVYVMILLGGYRESAKRVRRPVKDGAALRAPDLRHGRLAGWLADSRVIALLRRFAVATAIPIGVFILSLLVAQVALSISL